MISMRSDHVTRPLRSLVQSVALYDDESQIYAIDELRCP